MVDDGVFADLRKLSGCLARGARPVAGFERLIDKLGPRALPLLGRAIRDADPARRDGARRGLARLAATPARERVLRALREVTVDASDDAKVCALGLLAELGEPTAARFRDPATIQRRSALALAAQLDGDADVASVVDLMTRQLDGDEIAQLVEVLVEPAPTAAHRLAVELIGRLDLDRALRDRIARIAARAVPDPDALAATPRAVRPHRVTVLVEAGDDAAAGRSVVIAAARLATRRYRRWAVLITATGAIEDCLHEDEVAEDGDARALIARLCAEGYRVASTDREHARAVVAAAARRTARAGRALGSAYYLGRDLLALGDAHVVDRARAGTQADGAGGALARAIELLAAGEAAAARAVLERGIDGARAADVAGALGACLLAEGQPAAAVAPLERAVAGDPGWPLHHWNLATALHAVGDARGCYHALRRFVTTSAAPTAVLGDPEQPARLARAHEQIAQLERAARLAGTSLARPRSRRRRATRTPTTSSAPGCRPA